MDDLTPCSVTAKVMGMFPPLGGQSPAWDLKHLHSNRGDVKIMGKRFQGQEQPVVLCGL